MDTAARRHQLISMGQPEAWTRHHIDKLDRNIHTYRVGERVRVHSITNRDGLRQISVDGEVAAVDPAWPRYLVLLDTGWQTYCRPDSMEPLSYQEALF